MADGRHRQNLAKYFQSPTKFVDGRWVGGRRLAKFDEVFRIKQENSPMIDTPMVWNQPIRRGAQVIQEKWMITDEGKVDYDIIIQVACHINIHVSCHINNFHVSQQRWPTTDGQVKRFGEVYSKIIRD
jgi:hypothetical protein